MVGDSLAVGLNPFLRKLATTHGVNYASESKGGTMMRHWIGSAAFRSHLQQSGAGVVIVSLGTNDTYSELTADKLHQDALAMLEVARGADGRKILWVLPPRLPKEDRATPAIRDTKVEVFESASVEIPMGGDKIHPTSAGYAMWAGLIWRQATCGAGEPARMESASGYVTANRQRQAPAPWLRLSADRVRTIREGGGKW